RPDPVVAPLPLEAPSPAATETPRSTAARELAAAPAWRRLGAAALDLLLVGLIDAVVLYFTVRLCGLPLSREAIAALPPVPLAAFLLLLDAGYAAAFAAATGQTIGKMAFGVRIVGCRDASRPDGIGLSAAVLRTAAYVASALPVGLGFLPMIAGRERRTLHDRLADTRVVRA
ncbi:MAG TPA: RDD family protein, partial [Vicinamibacterales bacterium]|nr:RDD family protein [Vicinamibacterales bacterium]